MRNYLPIALLFFLCFSGCGDDEGGSGFCSDTICEAGHHPEPLDNCNCHEDERFFTSKIDWSGGGFNLWQTPKVTVIFAGEDEFDMTATFPDDPGTRFAMKIKSEDGSPIEWGNSFSLSPGSSSFVEGCIYPPGGGLITCYDKEINGNVDIFLTVHPESAATDGDFDVFARVSFVLTDNGRADTIITSSCEFWVDQLTE